MEIRRSDMPQRATDSPLRQDRDQPKVVEREKAEGLSDKGAASFDALRSRVVSLAQRIAELQTEISLRQAQLEFVNQLGESGAWQRELRRFMAAQYPSAELQLREGQTLQDFQHQTTVAIAELRSTLAKRETEAQNILAAGLLEPDPESAIQDGGASRILIKDFADAERVFNRIRPDAVRNLLH
ncbi:MAG: hypothetical protein N2Z22_09470 [Turneriella sp.]|nr:hypothetical protein [Turneriella sp.]